MKVLDTIIGALLVYIGFAFVVGEMNPTVWSIDVRYTAALFIPFGGLCGALLHSDK